MQDFTSSLNFKRLLSVFCTRFLSKASRRTRLCVWMHSSLWASCCGCRQHPRRRSGCRGWRWAGCCPRCLRLRPPRYRTSACGWVTCRLPIRCRRLEPWRTGRSRIRCRSTGGTARSWSGSGSSGSGCRGMEEAGRCGSGWRWASRPRWDRRFQCWTG